MNICTSCGERCELTEVDKGIGPYEFGSERGNHVDIRTVSACCEGDVEAVDAREWLSERYVAAVAELYAATDAQRIDSIRIPAMLELNDAVSELERELAEAGLDPVAVLAEYNEDNEVPL